MDYRDLMNTLPSKTDLTSNEYKSQGDILKELKRVQSINPDEINFPGIDNLELFGITLNQAKNNFKQKRTDAINALGSKYEQFIEDGPRERFDLPPLKDGMLGIKAAGSEQGMAQAKVLRDIKSAKDKQGAKEEPYDGPFGKLGEYFSKNADKREELFDQLSSIGQRLVQPTKPGEARSFVRDLVEGSAAGERKTMAKASAEAEADYKRALAGQADRPDNTTAYDNAYTIVKGQGKFKEGTPEFASAIAKMMTFITASPALTALNKQLSDLQASLKRATNDQEKASIANQIASTKSQINALTGGTGLGTSESATSVYDSTKKNKKDEKL